MLVEWFRFLGWSGSISGFRVSEVSQVYMSLTQVTMETWPGPRRPSFQAELHLRLNRRFYQSAAREHNAGYRGSTSVVPQHTRHLALRIVSVTAHSKPTFQVPAQCSRLHNVLLNFTRCKHLIYFTTWIKTNEYIFQKSQCELSQIKEMSQTPRNTFIEKVIEQYFHGDVVTCTN